MPFHRKRYNNIYTRFYYDRKRTRFNPDKFTEGEETRILHCVIFVKTFYPSNIFIIIIISPTFLHVIISLIIRQMFTHL